MIDVREVDGQTVTTVSNYAVVRKQRLAEIAAIKTLSEKLAVSPAPFQATVLRVDNERGFAIIDLGNNLTGMLHVSGMIGDADTRNAALAATAPGDIKTVIFAQVSERRGRIRLDLNECAAA